MHRRRRSPSAVVSAGWLKHVGRWEGTYTKLTKSGAVVDKHDCCLEIGIHGDFYSQRNTYTWRDAQGNVTKQESFLFPGKFEANGEVTVAAEKIEGWGRALDDAGTVLFYGAYKPGKMVHS